MKRDTIKLKLLNYEVRFENDGDDLSVFVKQNSGENWTLDQTNYYDTFSSLALNNLSTYEKAENKILELKYPVNLPETDSLAFFSFFAKWNIEKNIDHLKTYISTDGLYWDAICGNYSQSGNIDQGEDEPVLDGFQPDWVNVVYNISDYIGKTIYFKLVFRSDAKVNREGINIDKLQILSVPGSRVGKYSQEDYSVQVYPNPATNDLYISRLESGQAVFKLIDGQGKVAKTAILNSASEKIDINYLSPGLYIYQILNANGKITNTGKTVILK